MICRTIKRIETLAKPSCGVYRKPMISRKEVEALMVDGTKQTTQWLADDAAQWSYYFGKKKRHTLKAE